jgi:hypothetical protein
MNFGCWHFNQNKQNMNAKKHDNHYGSAFAILCEIQKPDTLCTVNLVM